MGFGMCSPAFRHVSLFIEMGSNLQAAVFFQHLSKIVKQTCDMYENELCDLFVVLKFDIFDHLNGFQLSW